MAENEILALKCVNPECGKPFKMKRPAKTGIYNIGCPHCSNKFKVKIPGTDAVKQNIADSESHAGEEAKTTPDFSQAPAITLESTFRTEKDYEVTCPHCKEHKLAFKPAKPGHKEFSCPHCHGRIAAEVVLPTKVLTGDSELLQLIRGKLILLRKWGFNKEFPLREGSNIIGREDAGEPSDISVKGDGTMSRRSVKLEMLQTEKGYHFKFTVLKAANPVLVNGEPLKVGDSVSLNFGDTIVMGSTKFRFDRQR